MTTSEIMLIYAVRYALGRKSTAVSTTICYVEDVMFGLSEQCRKTMLYDIVEQERFGYGDAVDERDWKSLIKMLEESLKK